MLERQRRVEAHLEKQRLMAERKAAEGEKQTQQATISPEGKI